MTEIKVAVNGYGVIGKRVADAVSQQPDMELIGVADVVADYRTRLAIGRGYRVFASSGQAVERMRQAGLEPAGTPPAWCPATPPGWCGCCRPSTDTRRKQEDPMRSSREDPPTSAMIRFNRSSRPPTSTQRRSLRHQIRWQFAESTDFWVER